MRRTLPVGRESWAGLGFRWDGTTNLQAGMREKMLDRLLGWKPLQVSVITLSYYTEPFSSARLCAGEAETHAAPP